MIPEKNTEEYANYLEEVISELMGIKNSLKKGQTRKENRKEVSMLQNAISALRHLRNKNNRQVMLLNNREKGLSESYTRDNKKEFSCEDIRRFLRGEYADDD